MHISPESDQSREADHRRWYCVCPRCEAKWFALEQKVPCPRCSTKVRSRERLTPPWLSAPASHHSPPQSSPPASPAADLKQMENAMPNNKPIHEIRLGTVRAAIWANENRTNDVSFAVTVSRLYKSGNDWKRSSSFHRDDLPVVAKIMEMAYAWIWDRQTAESHAADGP